eukprot:7384406-Prymnesium_polylepis.2
MIELTLILVYTCVLLIKTCEISPEVCSTYGFGDTGRATAESQSTNEGHASAQYAECNKWATAGAHWIDQALLDRRNGAFERGM